MQGDSQSGGYNPQLRRVASFSPGQIPQNHLVNQSAPGQNPQRFPNPNNGSFPAHPQIPNSGSLRMLPPVTGPKFNAPPTNTTPSIEQYSQSLRMMNLNPQVAVPNGNTPNNQIPTSQAQWGQQYAGVLSTSQEDAMNAFDDLEASFCAALDTPPLRKDEQAPAGQPLTITASSILQPEAADARSRANSRAADAEHEIKRRQIVNEILETERKYKDHLKILVDALITKVRQRKILTAEHIKDIFANIESLASFHTIFYTQIEQRISTWTPIATIGDIFLKYAAAFQLYTEFINNFDKSDARLKKQMKKNKQLVELEKDFMANPAVRRLDIASFLIMPVQRLPRYALLLEDLLRKTNSGHPDYQNLVNAISKVKEVSQFVNKQKGLAGQSHRMFEIDSTITGFTGKILKPSRQLVEEKDVTFITLKGPQVVLLSIFNDALLFTQKTGKNMNFVGLLALKNTKIAKADQMSIRGRVKALAGKSSSFDPLRYAHLLVLTHDEEEYLIAVNSEKEQDAWVTQIEGLKAGVQSLYWSKITNPGKPEPSARFNHSMNLISGNRLLVYGGQNRSSFYNEVWIQDTDQRTWSQLTIPNLPVLAEHSTALVGDKLYILGGHNMGIYNQSVFCLDTTTWQASELRPTGGKWVPRSGHSVVPVGNKLYIFGGNVYTSIREHKMHNDLWVLDLEANTWTEIEPATATKPLERTCHACVARNNKIYIFGGRNNTELNDIYTFDIATNSWSQIVDICGFVPTGRQCSMAILHEQFMMLIGGDSTSTVFSDVFLFNLETFVWSRIRIPVPLEPRTQAGAALISTEPTGTDTASTSVRNSVLYIFGGRVWTEESGRVASSDLVSVTLFDKWIVSASMNSDESGGQQQLEMMLMKKKREHESNARVISFSVASPNRLGTSTSFNFVHRAAAAEEYRWDGTPTMFDVQESMGHGTISEVLRAIRRGTDNQVVIKRLHVRDDAEKRQELLREMDMLLRCRNATLVRYFGAAFVDQSTLWVVSEYCGLGSVKDYMRNAGKTLSEKQIASICAQVLLGLSYLHSLNIVHRNVKCSNIYVSEKGDIQLGDFGLAECFESLAVKNIDTINQTNYWLAPDADEKSITTKSDIYSLGITVTEMAENTIPHKVFQKPKRFSNELLDFVAQCTTGFAKKRPTALQLLQHPFIKLAAVDACKDLADTIRKLVTKKPSRLMNLLLGGGSPSVSRATIDGSYNYQRNTVQPLSAESPTMERSPSPGPTTSAVNPAIAAAMVSSSSASPAASPPTDLARPFMQTEVIKSIIMAEMAELKAAYDNEINALKLRVKQLESEVVILKARKEGMPQ